MKRNIVLALLFQGITLVSAGYDEAVGAGVAIGFAFGGPVGAAIGGFAGYLACRLGWWCNIEPPDTTPPSVTCFPVETPIYTPAGSRTAVVTYRDAEASDNVGVDSSRGGQFHPSDLHSGDSFPADRYNVFFSAYDTSGIMNQCNFTFTVIARTCDYPGRFDNGVVECQNTPHNWDPVYGEQCTFTCHAGYNLIGEETQTCKKDETWSGNGSVICQIKTCLEPIVPANAEVSTCTAGYDFASVCLFTCLEGFSQAGGNSSSVHCTEHETWSGDPQDCVDSQGPIIENCPETQTVYVGASLDYAIASWDVPIASDNVDESVIVSLEEGLEPGSRFYLEPYNVYQIVYGAQDASGNVAIDCEFSIIVQVITCPPIQHAYRLNTSCPEGLNYGARCTFQCDAGYPLVGPDEVYCESTLDDPPVGYWNWGENMSSPFCEVVPCPPLEEPDNGALACETWLLGLVCIMACQADYDIPRTVSSDGQFVCSDTSGTWLPSDNVPDCSERRNGDSMRLPSELFYFSGNCTSADTQQQIKENFIHLLTQSSYSDICTLYPDCSVENVNVTCGRVTRRRKRLAQELLGDRYRRQARGYDYETIITFEFTLHGIYDPSLSAAEIDGNTTEQFTRLTDYFEHLIDDGKLDMEGLEIMPDSFRYAESLIICDLGEIAEYSTFTCRPCPKGTYYNIATESCTDCPTGTYQDEDGALQCTQCPARYSTKGTGSRNIDQCLPMCEPGGYSTDGLTPCALCALDTYSDDVMQTRCQPCPQGSHTPSIGSNSVLDCVTEFLPIGPCSTDRCNSHGVCTWRNGTYECHCTGGYSGNNCDVVPNPCVVNSCFNGATCVPGNGTDGYTCQCRDTYLGDLCQHHKVDGEWGEWSDWSHCSTSCDHGKQYRYRRCNRPAPNAYGDPCQGDDSQAQPCHIMQCPECVELRRPYGTRLDCTENGTTTTCSIYCMDGLITMKIYPATLICGPHTNYTWNPDITYNHLPSCSESRYPDRISQTLTVEFNSPPASDVEEEEIVHDITEEALQYAPCIDTDQCTVNVSISSVIENRRKKRSSSVIVTVTIEADTSGYDYIQNGVFNNNTAAEGLAYLTLIITQLEDFALAINDSAYNGTLTITVDSHEYPADPESVSVDGFRKCYPGQSAYLLLCINCPPGSYGDGVECKLCPLGEYQESEGQTSCDVCDDGYITGSTGSTNATDCIKKLEDTTAIDWDETDNNKDGDNAGKKKNNLKDEAIIAIVVGIFVLLVLIITTVTVCHCQKQRKWKIPRRYDNPALRFHSGPTSQNAIVESLH